jgi:ribulose kinase
MSTYAIGVDFGTESGRAVVVDTADGRVLAWRQDLVGDRPDPARARVYDELFAEYRALHDHFGRGGDDVMKRLRAMRARVAGPTA